MTDNRQTALRMIENIPAGLDNPEITTPDVTWWIPGRGVVDKAEFKKLAAFAIKVMRSSKGMKVHGITVDGDRVAVEVEGHMELKNGKTYNNFYHFLFLFRDGRIYQGKEYHDTLLADQSFEGLWGELE